jgi:hypothetical protein
MILYTAQYRYAGEDRLDITVKGKDPIGKIFASTWKMVMASKQGKLSWEEYSTQYRQLMRKSYLDYRKQWNRILARQEVTLFNPPRSWADLFLHMGAVMLVS